MPYVVVPMYAPTGEVNVEQLSERAGRELAPQLFEVGCQRFNTIKFANGQIGSTGLYPDAAAADRGRQVGAEWVKSVGIMAGSDPARRVRGEIIFSYQAPSGGSLDHTFGVIRVYRSSASAEDAQQAFEQDAKPILQDAAGLLRYTALKTEDGFTVLTAHMSRDAATQLTARVRDMISKSGSRSAKVFPEPPEVIEGDIIHSFTP